MAWSTPGTAVTGATATAVFWNANVRDNLAALNPDDTVNAASWSPTIKGSVDDTLSFTVTGRQWRVGPLQFVWARFVFTDPPSGAGTLFSDLPVAASGITAGSSSGQAIGSAYLYDDGTSTNRQSASVFLNSSTTVRFVAADGGWATDTAPFTWATGDVLTFHAVYPVA